MIDQSASRCEAVVYHRDQYRVCRDGKRHFRMHYTKSRCSRKAVESGLCRQHHMKESRGSRISREPTW